MQTSPTSDRVFSATPCPSTKSGHALKEILAASLGNAFEWFDFIIYGYFATLLAKLFFPPGDEFTSLLLVMATFALGFIVRPLGSIVFGIYSDRYGRKKALLMTIWLMVAGTAGIGLAPTYEVGGWVGAIMIVFARLLQGFGSSGEYGAAVAFLVEKAPANRRYLYASFHMTSTMLAIVMAGMTGTFMFQFLGQAAVESWGWRIPFLFGLLIGPIGYYIRRNVTETLVKEAPKHEPPKAVLKKLFGDNLLGTLSALLITIAGTISFYLLLIYMPTFARRELGVDGMAPFLSSTFAGVVLIVMCPIVGLIADKIKPNVCLGFGLALMAILAYPLFSWLISAPSSFRMMAMMSAIAVPLAIISGLTPGIVSQIFTADIRSTGLSVTYNLPATLFGGVSPLIVSYLIASTGNLAAPAFYIMIASVVGFTGILLLMKKR